MTSPTTAMAREIAEQPDTIAATVTASLARCEDLRRLASGRRHILLVARGSSDNAAVYARYLLETHTGRSAALAAPSLATHYEVRREMSDTLVISLSQSGETEEIVATQAWGAASGARTIAITNVADSSLAHEADLALVTPAGPELAVPATKSYTSQLAAIAAIADALGPPASSLRSALDEVPDAVARVLATRDGVEAAVDALATGSDTLVSGRGLVYGTALEAALKLEETCLRPVRGLSYADLRHGPIAVVGGGLTAMLVSAADGPMVSGLTHLAGELHDRGAHTIGIGGNAAFTAAVDVPVFVPAVSEAVAPLVTIVPAQLVVESLARRIGLNPDAPRGLSKVTRTDVDD